MNFENFLFTRDIMAGITASGYQTPTPIQSQSIPKIMQGRDIIGLAQTGTGKTAAFVLPILHRLANARSRGVGALVIAPTRELAQQIHQEFKSLGRRTGVRSVAVYGGAGIHPQIQGLKKADVVVACPGRLLDHINRGNVDFSQLKVLVLDEADQMFDMGFLPDVRRILNHLPDQDRQTLLFSATMPSQIRQLAERILHDPARVQIGLRGPAKTVKHALFPVSQHLKTALLLKLLDQLEAYSVLVFTRTKIRAKRLDQKLSRAGYRCASLQGNLSQGRRRAALEGFRQGMFQILVATDIAARGIDIQHVSHVINFDMPDTTDAYIHRVGRTGRANCTGEAFSLITEADDQKVRAINKILGKSIAHRRVADFNYEIPAASISKKTQATNRGRRSSSRRTKWSSSRAFSQA